MSLLSDMVERLAIGTVQFGQKYGVANRNGQVSYDEAKSIIHRANRSGIDTLDTAIAYGESENRLGEIGIQNWKVVSKLPEVPDECEDVFTWVVNSVQESLHRLKQKNLYALLLHRPEQLLGDNGMHIYSALQQLKEDGLIKNIGASIYIPQELESLNVKYKLDIIQAPFNILDRRLIESGWLSRLAEQDIELHVRSVFLQGLLLMPTDEMPQKFNKWASLWSDWDEWLKVSDMTPLEACLRYVLSFSEISKVIVGVDSLQQLNEIISAANGISPVVTEKIQCSDIDLINPAHWSAI